MIGGYKREYCCPRCGLIWFDTVSVTSSATCKECGNNNKEDGLYAVDSMGYAYAYASILADLRQKGKEIHYHNEHPYYEKKSKI